MKFNFDGEKRYILFGCGLVGSTFLELLVSSGEINWEKVFIFDREDKVELLNKLGVPSKHFKQLNISTDNYKKIILEYARPGDFFINLCSELNCLPVIEFCLESDIHYFDTSIEYGFELSDEELYKKPVSYYTNARVHSDLMRIKDKIKAQSKTSLVTHGMNPGMVSHLAKEALTKFAELKNKLDLVPNHPTDGWAELARALDIRYVYVNERDSQELNKKHNSSESFACTWSPVAYYHEAFSPSEIYFGTHEEKIPQNWESFNKSGLRSYYSIIPGGGIYGKTWMPHHGNVCGNIIQHMEVVTIGKLLTSFKEDQVDYSPTVAFVYRAPDFAMDSLEWVKANDWNFHDSYEAVREGLTEGIDEIGIFLVDASGFGLWHGSQLDICRAREIAPNANATCLQVVSGVVSGLLWMIDNPNRGLVLPEDVDHKEALKYSRTLLEPIVTKTIAKVQATTPYMRDRSSNEEFQISNFLV